ncbi:hypothetical protein K461DRAFT_279393 [Myriangium duriaei CBS 260.36]|uniref:Protein EFR3 n=1 Tax=Myriangium duriaei CBS 260.36 TaxID=1168546 RepID=A0A9P4J3U7_9PEZI|nr:hypothetical protein K461DRAFT_279393 [Myriangium duriaei CBS 260.36]
MEAIKQSVRPKHQVLILKCYPRLPKNSSAAEIKPKGSELSYLLYYASSRRSKLSKVGAFLEKKVIHDLWKGRTAPVQITLQILSAFLNNPAIGGTGAQGFGLFAPYILRIIREVLKDANEAILVEAAVPTWDGFCRHQDHITLSADADFCALFAEVVRLWAGYATKEQVQPDRTTERRGKMRVGVTDNVKLRMAGLMSLKSIADSDTLVSDAGRQLDTVMPVILQNLYDGDGDLDQIMELNAQMETQEKEKGKPRPSMSVAKEVDHEDGDVRAAGRSVAEADRLADQEASILALRCLKSVFSFESRVQVRAATLCVLQFILAHRPNPIKFKKAENHEEEEHQWAVQLFKSLCNWVPVQDRFVALFTAVELLIRSPMAQDDMYRQVLLARIISQLLASDVNLIGLSVMDVLLGILRHMVNVISDGSRKSIANGNSDMSSTNDSHHSATTLSTKHVGGETPMIDAESRKNPIRSRLLFQLQQCISNLAVHVYYTDQISDMVIAILLRLRPGSISHQPSLQVPARSHSVSASGSHNAGEDSSPAHSDAGVSNSSHRNDSRQMSQMSSGIFFNSAIKREIALNAVCSIILCANDSSRSERGYVSTNRNPVPMSVWEGSQWLMKEPEEGVRGAYVRAFSAWLDYELPKLALEKALAEEKKMEREWKRKSLNSDLARRAANTASARKAANKRTQTAILQAVHMTTVDLLAIVDKDGTTVGRTQVADRQTNATDFATGSSNSPSEQTLSSSPLSTNEIMVEMRRLAAKLHKISTSLDLMDLEEFRHSQPPALPIYPPSPKPPSSNLAPNHHGNSTPESDSDFPSRRPSNAASFSNLKRPEINGRARSLSGARRSTSLSGAGRVSSFSAIGRPPSSSRLPSSSARHDFASGASSNGRVSPAPAPVEELKRLLATSQSRSSSLAGLGLSAPGPASSSGAASSAGAGNAAVARRAVGPSADTETTGSESLVEIEGSWAGTSFATPDRSRDRERDAKRVDVRALLESLPTGEDEAEVGKGGPPL